MTEADKFGYACKCNECGCYFGTPTGGGACPYCGSSDWREDGDD